MSDTTSSEQMCLAIHISGTACCGADTVWVSYNPEIPKNAGKIDHRECLKCGREIK